MAVSQTTYRSGSTAVEKADACRLDLPMRVWRHILHIDLPSPDIDCTPERLHRTCVSWLYMSNTPVLETRQHQLRSTDNGVTYRESFGLLPGFTDHEFNVLLTEENPIWRSFLGNSSI